MIATFVRVASSEWLKRRRSLTTWLVTGAAAFVPSIVFLSRFRRLDALPAIYQDPEFWPRLWVQSWEAMALMILPLTCMLLVSLITQIEDRNNGWKQMHATPVPLASIFLAKLAVMLALVAELVVLFTAAVYLAGVLPALVIPGVPAPARPFPLAHALARATAFLADSLPIVSLQYLLALRFRTFLAPLAIGMALWILSIGTISWQYNYLIPYSHAGLDYLAVEYHRVRPLPASLPAIAGACFLVFTVAGYVMYARRRDKG